MLQQPARLLMPDQLWLLYSKVVPSTGKRTAESGRLRREVVRLQRELAAISAQDEFTKWAKMRRQLDKAQAEHDKQGKLVLLFTLLLRVTLADLYV